MTQLQDFLNTPVSQLMNGGRGVKQGDLFGVELECEGRNVDIDGSHIDILKKGWQAHNDGSLRNHHGSSCEWVFNGPAQFKPSVERIENLFKYFEARKARLVTSNRTSTHVHFNMGDKNVYQLVNLFILFTILENLFDRYCGEDRNGNLFCLSSRYAEAQVDWLMKSCFKDFSLQAYGEQNRYCALNLASIHKFGTVEFRGMRGLDNKEDVISWLGILNEFCDYACYTMTNPVRIIEDISLKSPKVFLGTIFSGDNVKLLTKDLTEMEINQSIYDGVRLVQMICYKIGTEFDKVHLRGRDFWASFQKDQEPILDIEEGIVAPPPLRRGQRGNVNIGGAVGAGVIRNDQIEQHRINFNDALQAFVNAERDAGIADHIAQPPGRVEPQPQRLNPFVKQARFRQAFGDADPQAPAPAPHEPPAWAQRWDVADRPKPKKALRDDF